MTRLPIGEDPLLLSRQGFPLNSGVDKPASNSRHFVRWETACRIDALARSIQWDRSGSGIL